MDSLNFSHTAKQIFNDIVMQIEAHDKDSLVEIEESGDVVFIITNNGNFALNAQSVRREIWLSSPISGAYHFSRNDKSWINKDNISLYTILSDELSQILNKVIVLKEGR